MNIVILQGGFFPVPPLLGGAVEKMWFKLGQEFARFGHKVTQISKAYDDLPGEEVIEGVTHKRVKGFVAPKSMILYKVFDAIYSWRAIRVIPVQADVVITNSFWAPIFLGFNSSFVVYVDVARMPKGQMKLYSRADCLRANSSAVVEAIKSEINVSEYHRISLIPNPLPFKLADEIDFSVKKKVILFCGRVHEEKGLDLLIQAVREIDMAEWVIKIVGPWDVAMGGSGEVYKNKLEKSCGEVNIQFIGPIFDEAVLNQFYKEAAIFVYPSIAEKGETFGLAPLEAMAWGAVPIVSNLECFKDFINNNENGLIFDHRGEGGSGNLTAAIKKIIVDKELREKLSVSALAVRKTHSAAGLAEQFVSNFEKLLSARKA